MYAYIRGKVISKLPDNLIVETHGVGYRLLAAASLLDRFPSPGEETVVYTHLYVREDVFALYGFPAQEDVGLFELLLTVTGIGPKVASSVVGSISPGQFALAVITGDIKLLTSVRGIGRKGAERMILELKDKLKGVELASGLESGVSADVGRAGTGRQAEAISALMVLGYSSQEASRAVGAVDAPERSLEELIRLALRQLARS